MTILLATLLSKALQMPSFTCVEAYHPLLSFSALVARSLCTFSLSKVSRELNGALECARNAGEVAGFRFRSSRQATSSSTWARLDSSLARNVLHEDQGEDHDRPA